MKTKSVYVLLLGAIAISFVADKNKNSFTPPGTVLIQENLYFDKAEVRNIDWLEYIAWQKVHHGETSAAYKTALPDTLVWRDPLSCNEPYVQYYFRHPAYKDFPVVGVSYEQAIAYCNWRTERITEFLELRKKQKSSTYIPKKFRFRLPTKAEWELVAKAGYDAKTQKKLDTKYAGRVRYNLCREATLPANPGNDVTTTVYSYWPNSFGVYNLIGNVLEMTSEKGIAKGGGWRNQIEEITVEKDFSYSGATAWMGFRCVCEIMEK